MADEKRKAKSLVKDVIEKLREEAGTADDTFDPSKDDPKFGPDAFKESQAQRGARIIDSLLASVPRNQGFYLKLYREIGPNKFELKERIDDYETWSDLELEIANLIKYHTKRHPTRWGTGTYRVVVWNDQGIREKYPPYDFFIDAGELDPVAEAQKAAGTDPSMVVSAAFDNFRSTMEAVKLFMPPTLDPAKQAEMMGQSYMAGIQAKAQEGSTMAQMMATMMTGMMTMVAEMAKGRGNTDSTAAQLLASTTSTLRDLGLLSPQQPTNLIEQVRTLKDLGVIATPQPTDLLSQASQIKQLMDVIGTLGGQREVGTFETIATAVAPHIGKIAESISNVAEAKKFELMTQLQPGGQPMMATPTSSQLTQAAAGNGTSPINPMHPALQELYRAVLAGDTRVFPKLSQFLSQVNSQLLTDIKSNQATAENLITILAQYGGDPFRQPVLQSKLQTFVENFIRYVKGAELTSEPQAESNLDGKYQAKCNVCGMIWNYANQAEFEAEPNHTCGNEYQGIHCMGVLEPKVIAL